jgi:hypothetical protein
MSGLTMARIHFPKPRASASCSPPSLLRILRESTFMDMDAAADEPSERAAVVGVAHPAVEDPSELAVAAAQPEFLPEGRAPMEMIEVVRHAPRHVVRVDPLGPAVAHFLR